MTLTGLADYHTHTPLCRHAEGWPLDYTKVAIERGLSEIGFSDHSPMERDFDDWRMQREELPRYIEAVEAARAEYPQIPVRLGLEVDYLPGQESWIQQLAELAPWDYLIGSVHYIEPGWEVDHPKFIFRFEGSGTEEIWERYWVAYEQAIRTRLFDFMAHPDLPKKFGHRPAGDLRRFYEPAIAALAETGTAFEINTAGLRKPVEELYPHGDFLRLAREAGIPLLINSDAHLPEEVGAGFTEAVAAARAAGYTETLRFEGRQRKVVPLPEV